jgi:hypothetical protein
MEWIKFDPKKGGANRQKLPAEKKVVLCLLRSDDPSFPNPHVVGYLKYHSGVKSAPYFVTPGARLEGVQQSGDDRVIAYCDCLPNDYDWGLEFDRAPRMEEMICIM